MQDNTQTTQRHRGCEHEDTASRFLFLSLPSMNFWKRQERNGTKSEFVFLVSAAKLLSGRACLWLGGDRVDRGGNVGFRSLGFCGRLFPVLSRAQTDLLWTAPEDRYRRSETRKPAVTWNARLTQGSLASR